eukprot:TRINITY_DN7982_c1_g1_i4.p2 TRINITY_DN7982_c1_g1~~TRINITY_DN7982_c1_g1_i4.p2  ORF type:complete len:249 (-),score=8.90 TRINITY_DN7982_c1_g1_i4:381-1031(-)
MSQVAQIRNGTDQITPILDRTSCSYTKNYCEENVYFLCKQISDSSISQLKNLFVVFISNHAQKIPIWQQGAGDPKNDRLVVWDYHVILIQTHENDRKTLVWDLDTVLNFPCNFDDYCKDALRTWLSLNPQYQKFYRVVSGLDFLQYFASDRSHMKGGNGTWLAPPPRYPPIESKYGEKMNLNKYLNMNQMQSVSQYGQVFSEQEFVDYFSNKGTHG